MSYLGITVTEGGSDGVAVAVMRNRFTTGDFTAAAKIGQLAAGLFA